MQYAQSSHHYAIHPFFLVLSAVLHLVVVTVVVQYSRHHAPPPPVNEIIEVTMFELPAPEPIVAPPPTPEPIVEPPPPEPIVEPPPPEPIVEPPPPEPEPVKIVEAPPVVEKPEPKVVEPPKPKPLTREERIRERLRNSNISQDDPKKRQEEQRRQEQAKREQEAALKRMQERLNQATTGFKPSPIKPAAGSKVVGVSAAQMAQYNRYMGSCVTPRVNALWQRLGPSGLEDLPTPAVIRFMVNPAGRVLSYVFVSRSNSAAVNDAGDALGKALMAEGLPPFRQVGLTTEGNAALSIDFTLKYER